VHVTVRRRNAAAELAALEAFEKRSEKLIGVFYMNTDFVNNMIIFHA
jgi:hypothetical protein